jgi:predicted alpha/beta-hydrolase family hydrolase
MSSASRSAVRVYLGPGASGSAATMEPFAAGLRARGVDAVAIDLPKRRAEEAVDALLAIAPPGNGVVVGGQSYGGRVASLAAAEHRYRGLICFCYPLHRPGHPDGTTRAEHWTVIDCPVLLLSGEADPFARIELLREAAGRLRRGTLHTWPGLGHTMRPVLDEALDQAAAFVKALPGR